MGEEFAAAEDVHEFFSGSDRREASQNPHSDQCSRLIDFHPAEAITENLQNGRTAVRPG